MSATAEHFASIDAQLATARMAWEAEKLTLEQHVMQLEAELAIRTKLHDEAIVAKDRALRSTAKLLAQFGVVATVFDEAKQLALEAGLYTEATTEPKDPPGVAAAKSLIDTATGSAS